MTSRFGRALEAQDEFVQMKAAQILTVLLTYDPLLCHKSRFLMTSTELSQDCFLHANSKPSSMCLHPLCKLNRPIGVILLFNVLKVFYPDLTAVKRSGGYQGLLRGTSYQVAFDNVSNFYPRSFVEILNKHPGPQMCYQVSFCLWLLSFEANIAEEINK